MELCRAHCTVVAGNQGADRSKELSELPGACLVFCPGACGCHGTGGVSFEHPGDGGDR